MIYYVTGANGFIGKHVVNYLNGLGHEVYRVPRPITQFHIRKDQGPFGFVHLSAYGNHYNQKDCSQIISANISDLIYILDLLKDSNCEKFYNVSTSSIQLEYQTLYSTSKHFGEILVNSCNDDRFVNIRPYSVYGPGEADHRFIPTVIRALQRMETIDLDPFAKHDWIYVYDFIDAMFKGYTEIGSGESVSNVQIVNYLQSISGYKLDYVVKKMRSYDNKNWISPDPAPGRILYDGLIETYKYYARIK